MADGDLQPLRLEVPRSHGPADPPHGGIPDLRRARRARRGRGGGAVPLAHGPGPGRRRGDGAGQLADRGRPPRHPQGRRDGDVPRHHVAGRPGDPHARGRPAGGRPHARAGRLPRPADPRRAGPARDEASPRAAPLAGRPEGAPRQHLLHERNHRDAQGGGVPARRLREPRPDLRGLLRSRPGNGRHLAHLVPGLRRQHLRDVQRLGLGMRRGPADEGAGPVRPGPRPRPPRGRSHRALLPARPADHAHADPRAGSARTRSAATSFPAGEAFPAALVEPWTRGRRQIVNTYGPTEASTDTSRQSLRPGQPVTIGSPFPNVTYVILEAGELRPLPHGEAGELCIGGVHLARGYRNLPEETAEKFIIHPRFGRLYRTGDRCRIDIRTQQVHFLGRIDAQLKVRGHRVEIQPVEDLLQTQFGEIEAAVLDYQNQELVAFVVAPSVRRGPDPGRRSGAGGVGRPGHGDPRATASPAVGPDADLPRRAVRAQPGVREDRPPATARPLPAAGRRRGAGGGRAGRARRAPTDRGRDADTGGDEALAICRELLGATLGRDDVFADHGGHSIVIARLTPGCGRQGGTCPWETCSANATTARRIAALPREAKRVSVPVAGGAAAAQPGHGREAREEAAGEALSVRRFTALQALFLLLLYAPPVAAFSGSSRSPRSASSSGARTSGSSCWPASSRTRSPSSCPSRTCSGSRWSRPSCSGPPARAA